MKNLAEAKRNREAFLELLDHVGDMERAAFDEAIGKMLTRFQKDDETFLDDVMKESMKRMMANLRSCPKEELVALDKAIERRLSSSKSDKEKAFLRRFKRGLR